MSISIKEFKDEEVNFGKPYIEVNFKGMVINYYGVESIDIIEENQCIELFNDGIEYIHFENINEWKEIKRQIHEFKFIEVEV